MQSPWLCNLASRQAAEPCCPWQWAGPWQAAARLAISADAAAAAAAPAPALPPAASRNQALVPAAVSIKQRSAMTQSCKRYLNCCHASPNNVATGPLASGWQATCARQRGELRSAAETYWLMQLDVSSKVCFGCHAHHVIHVRQRRPGGVPQRPLVVQKVCGCSGRHQHCDHHNPGRRHRHHPNSSPARSDCDCRRGPGLVLLQLQKHRRAAATASAVRHCRQPRIAVNGAISNRSLNGRVRAENLHRTCLPGKHRQTGRCSVDMRMCDCGSALAGSAVIIAFWSQGAAVGVICRCRILQAGCTSLTIRGPSQGRPSIALWAAARGAATVN